MDRDKAVCLTILAEQACRLAFGLADFAKSALEGSERDLVVQNAMQAVVTIDIDILEFVYDQHPELRPPELERVSSACRVGLKTDLDK